MKTILKKLNITKNYEKKKRVRNGSLCRELIKFYNA